MRISRYFSGKAAALLLLASCSLTLASCSDYPVDTHDICIAATDGLPASPITVPDAYQPCTDDVNRAAFIAAHKAAEPYRMLPR